MWRWPVGDGAKRVTGPAASRQGEQREKPSWHRFLVAPLTSRRRQPCPSTRTAATIDPTAETASAVAATASAAAASFGGGGELRWRRPLRRRRSVRRRRPLRPRRPRRPFGGGDRREGSNTVKGRLRAKARKKRPQEPQAHVRAQEGLAPHHRQDGGRRLQGSEAAAQLPVRDRQDPAAPDHRQHREATARGRARGEARAPSRNAALPPNMA